MPKRTKKGASKAKGRPINLEEFERMLEQPAKVRPHEEGALPVDADDWKRLLHGLWWSGLRLDEALNLTWDREDKLRVMLAGEESLLFIPADCQKNNQNQTCPIVPEFVTFLEETPASERKGYVFRLPFRRSDTVSKTVTAFGKGAGIIVSREGRDGKVKYASAHDLRRSFGQRWSNRVMPPVLQRLMRHSNIETTMSYYVDHDARTVGKMLWQTVREQEAAASVTGKSLATERIG